MWCILLTPDTMDPCYGSLLLNGGLELLDGYCVGLLASCKWGCIGQLMLLECRPEMLLESMSIT